MIKDRELEVVEANKEPRRIDKVVGSVLAVVIFLYSTVLFNVVRTKHILSPNSNSD